MYRVNHLVILIFCSLLLSACPRLIDEDLERSMLMTDADVLDEGDLYTLDDGDVGDANVTDSYVEDMMVTDLSVLADADIEDMSQTDLSMGEICLPQTERCNAELRQVCNLNGSAWEELACPTGQLCRSVEGVEGCYDPIRCGDSVVEGSETCDEPPQDCTYEADDCQICRDCNLEEAEAPRCGDDVINGPEQCDGEWYCASDCRFSAPCAESDGGCPDIEWVEIEGGDIDGVTLSTYQLLKTEVTVQQYLTCVDAGMCSLPYTHGEFDQTGATWRQEDIQNQPIRNITFRQMIGFSRWIGATIPTELEWEWAARSRNSEWNTPWGEDIDTCDRAVIGFDGVEHNCDFDTPRPVCSMTTSNSIDGLCDMIGNVSEVTISKEVECTSAECMLRYGITKGMHWRSSHLEPSRGQGVGWSYVLQDVPINFVDRYSIIGSPLLTFVDYTGFRPRKLRTDENVLEAVCADGTLTATDETCEARDITTETCSSEDECSQTICNSDCQEVRPAIGHCGDSYINRSEEECDGQEICQIDCKLPPCYTSEVGCPSLNFVQLQGGSFAMGSNGRSDELPIHDVNVETFEMMRSEITLGQYRLCVEANACSAPSAYNAECNWSSSPDAKEDHPVNCVSWRQVMEFAAWVGARLPSEAEWEYAARGQGQEITYPWGNDPPTCLLASHNSCITGTSPVCSHPAGNTAQGLCDMAGSVWEWVHDEYHSDYNGAPTNGSGWCTGVCPGNANDTAYDPNDNGLRSVRGGGWLVEHQAIRTVRRGGNGTGYLDTNRGARLARGTICGDGTLGGEEECDDGNIEIESCDANHPDCMICDNHCQLVAGEAGRCGDGYINEGEVCDELSSACSYEEDNCQLCINCTWQAAESPRCGDGIVNGPEQCDGEWFCGADCLFSAPCADSETGCPEIEWINIEVGSFMMGIEIDSFPDGRPIVPITIEHDYQLSKSEVTVRQYKACVESGACTEPLTTYLCTWGDEEKLDYPVNCITVYQMASFARWIGATFPSEAEWEFAAQSRRSVQLYPWGNTLDLDGDQVDDDLCNFGVFKDCEPTRVYEVCSRPLGNTDQGVCDMLGNVEEYILDTLPAHSNKPIDGRANCGDAISCLLEDPLMTKGLSFLVGDTYARDLVVLGVHPYGRSSNITRLTAEREASQIINETEFIESSWSGMRVKLLREDEAPITDICGDGIIGENENCDDGNHNVETCAYDQNTCLICNAECQLQEGEPGRCGDGYINRTDEECDGQEICQIDCQLPPCYESDVGCPDINWIEIEGGEFTKGTGTSIYRGSPQVDQQINHFKASQSVVTIEQYMHCVNADVCTVPNCSSNLWCHYQENGYEDHPANFISWVDAMTFAQWVGGRLLSESEWEFAAKSRGERSPYSWGADEPSCDLANIAVYESDEYQYCINESTPVCAYPASHTLQGLCDMSGLISEWVLDDAIQHYNPDLTLGQAHCESADCFDLELDSQTYKVLRGGGFRNGGENIRSDYRYFDNPGLDGSSYAGARIAKGTICGDGIISGDEQCDDGNIFNESCDSSNPDCMICDTSCQLVVGTPGRCGDGYTNEGESCDGEPYCTITCEWAPCVSSPEGCPVIDWVTIEGGRFSMGDVDYSDATPVHEVSISDFKIMKSEVTVGMYRKCVEAEACQAPYADYEGCTWTAEPSDNESKPIACVGWVLTQEFSRWMGARLPSESEWEYVATNGGMNNYPWGDTDWVCEVTTSYVGCPDSSVGDVCSTLLGNSSHGVCDLVGSVIEWVQDEYVDNYNDTPRDGSANCSLNNCLGTLTTPHSIRGGNGVPSNSIARYFCNTSNACNYVGFRLAK